MHPERKARGAFFTPPELCDYLTAWAVREATDSVLEPSCGEAAFLISAGRRLRELGTLAPSRNLTGVEVHAPSAEHARAALAAAGLTPHVLTCNFFDMPRGQRFDTVIGNPPYVRYQGFAGAARSKAQEAALAQGVRLTGLASSWAAFVVHAAQYLKPHGRLGLVLPGELLSVNYASEVRRFLLERFARVRLVLFSELVFPGVLEEVVLLLAEGAGPTAEIEMLQVRHLHDLVTADQGISWTPAFAHEKWLPGLLSPMSRRPYDALLAAGSFVRLSSWGRTSLGSVTGNNNFFTLSVEQVAHLGLQETDLLPVSPPGSRHLRGLGFSRQAWKGLADDGQAVYLFYPRSDPGPAALRYIRDGLRRGVDRAYKCRVRNPWWRVPLMQPPDLFLTYMNSDTPRLVGNEAGTYYLNSVHGVRLVPELCDLGRDLLPVASLNSATLLGAELVGRAYGGGMLKIEPREGDLLPVPSSALLSQCATELRAIRPRLSSSLRGSGLQEAVHLVDRVLLTRALGLTHCDLRALRDARATLYKRRMARAAT